MATVPTIADRFGVSAEVSKFAREIVLGRAPKEAARMAGLAEEQGYALLASSKVVLIIEEEMRRILQTQAAPQALKTARELLGEDTPAATRAVASKLILGLAGYDVHNRLVMDKPDDVDLSEMSTDQLKAYLDKHTGEIDKLQGELAARAKPVTTPDSAPNSADRTLDIMELLD